VFIRELISNACDALERLRFLRLSGKVAGDSAYEIHLATDERNNRFILHDTGVGMTKEEMVKNLGVIARSGTREFLERVVEGGASAQSGIELPKGAERATTAPGPQDTRTNLIGQFGVGFYAAFMVADRVEVYSKPHTPNARAYKWSSDGMGFFEVTEAEGVEPGTKVILHLKPDAKEFARDERVAEIIKRYSNFVSVPIFLNGKKANVLEALWMRSPRSITEREHEDFYRFVSGLSDSPRFTLAYRTDAPLNIRSLLYVPGHKPSMFEMSQQADVTVSLYSRKVLIQQKAQSVLPKWLRFMRGVIDSEDIPLNLSRELLQNSALIRRLRNTIEMRVIKFLQEQQKREPEKFSQFLVDYGLYLREGILSTEDHSVREEIVKLLEFDSSTLPVGKHTTLPEYASRMKAGERTIFYFSAPSRHLAESNPYMESMSKRDQEVLFLYEPYDELVFMHMQEFDRKRLRSIESELQELKEDTTTVDSKNPESLTQDQADKLLAWIKLTLGDRVHEVKLTKRLSTHACLVSVLEMGAVRHFLRTTLADKTPEEKLKILRAKLEINPAHPLIKKLFALQSRAAAASGTPEATDLEELCRLLCEQLYENALATAGLITDSRQIVSRMNDLLTRAFLKLP
jgi:TNF receptor-associated protein 1